MIYLPTFAMKINHPCRLNTPYMDGMGMVFSSGSIFAH